MIMGKLRLLLIPLLLLASNTWLCADDTAGLNSSIANIYETSDDETRSVSPENFTGEKGQGGMATNGTGKHASSELGQGWKVSPSVHIGPGKTFTLADIKGPGCIKQIWMTPAGNWRHAIIRMYWDGETNASVECPVG